MDFTYSFLDRIFRYSIGEHGDFSGSKYDGDFSISLEEAQRRKHDFITDQLRIREGHRVIDLSCGWGPFLIHLETIRAEGIGVTLSEAQVRACRRHGLTVSLQDCRDITHETFGRFDAVVSVGGFEHFCSIEAWREGRQDEIYKRLFANVAGLLPTGGRFYLQTMVFGKNMIPYEDIDPHGLEESDGRILADLQGQFPGSWLPYGSEQVERCAAPHLTLIGKTSGRLDYIETIRQWGARYRRFSARKYVYYASLLPRFAFDRYFRAHISLLLSGANRLCFEREILDHYRFVFEKV